MVVNAGFNELMSTSWQTCSKAQEIRFAYAGRYGLVWRSDSCF